MRRFSHIDNDFILKNNLSIQEGYLLEWIINLPFWSESIVHEKKIYYFASKNKACADLPMLTTKVDTMYRHYKKLALNGFILIHKVEKKDYISITEKCKSWNSSIYSEKNPTSENNPNKLGKKSENNSEKNPTNKNTISNKKINNNNTLFKTENLESLHNKVLAYLNKKKNSKRSFAFTPSNLSHIKSRIKEKHTFEDFKKVIDFKVIEWENSSKMRKFIRPQTLFGNKFESYLIEAEESKNPIEKIHGPGSGNYKEHKTTDSDLI